MRREKAFKLADPGFAKFNRKTQVESQEVPKQILVGGTETYGKLIAVDGYMCSHESLTYHQSGAPEYPGRSSSPVSQAIDIWSLGCVFSLAATWVTLGLRGIHQFQGMREHVLKQRALAASQNQGTRTSQGDHFHDGHQVLKEVTQWHQLLRTSLRKTDSITSQVLDLVDNRMLLGSPEQRITATELCSKLSSMLQKTPDKNLTRMPSAIVSCLGEFAFTRDIRRSSSSERPLRTTYRQSFWSDQNSRWQDKESRGIELTDRSLVSSPNPSPGNTPPRNITVHSRVPRRLSIPITSSQSPRRGLKKIHPPMDVFQAREALERRRQERRSLNIFRHHTKKEEFSDGLLHSYFQGARDIVSHLGRSVNLTDCLLEPRCSLSIMPSR